MSGEGAPRPLASPPCSRDELDPGWLDAVDAQPPEPVDARPGDAFGRFMQLSGRAQPWLAALTGAVLGGALLWGLLLMPADHRIGETVRIMVPHVPAATLAVNTYLLMAVASALGLWRGWALAHLAARAAAQVGAAAALIAIVTGAIWGRPVWGAWWVWDPRLTAMVVMLFFYFGYLALWEAVEDPDAAASLTALLCLVGAVFAMLSRYAVEIFAGGTMHESGSLLLRRGLSMDDTLWLPVMAAMAGYHLLLMVLTLAGMRTGLRHRRAHALRLAQATIG
jgi:heme exporter protein C